MPQTELTVVIPVGPSGLACSYLREAVLSVLSQTVLPDALLLIDDMHLLTNDCCFESGLGPPPEAPIEFGIWQAPWRLGVPAAFNAGVGLAETEYVLMLGADDWLEPTAVEEFIKARDKAKTPGMTYFGFGIQYSDTGEIQWEPNNCAVVSKTLWRETGGFPPEAAVGACDSIFLSMIWGNDAIERKPIGGKPLYNYRRWEHTDTATRDVAWQGVIFSARDILTRTWERPDWGRYAIPYEATARAKEGIV